MEQSFGTRLRAVRETVEGLSARELDRLAGRPAGQAGLIETRGQRSVRDDIAAAFAEVLGMRAGYLLTGELPAFAVAPDVDPMNPSHRARVASLATAAVERRRSGESSRLPPSPGPKGGPRKTTAPQPVARARAAPQKAAPKRATKPRGRPRDELVELARTGT